MTKLTFRVLQACIFFVLSYSIFMKGKHSKLKVAFVIPVIDYIPWRVLKGVSRYIEVHNHWHLHFVCGDNPKVFSALKKIGVDGAFVSLVFDMSKNIVSTILAEKIPCIAFQASLVPEGMPYLTGDSFKAGGAIAEYFIGRGFRNFAYYSLNNAFWSQLRMKGFCKRVEEAGYSVNVYPDAYRKISIEQNQQIGYAWLYDFEKSVEWLRSLPKPVGLLVGYDGIGCDLLHAVDQTGMRIPEDIAVVGVDNNEVLCNAVRPQLSSMKFNVERTSYEAAELLDKIMAGEEVMSTRPLVCRMIGIVTRHSSDIMAIDDSEVINALKFIKKNHNSPIQVSDVVNSTFVSRRNLEKRFRSALNRSILDEIMRVRIEHVSHLLLNTEMSVDQITSSSTFSSTSCMIRAFKKYKSIPPQAFRKMHSAV